MIYISNFYIWYISYRFFNFIFRYLSKIINEFVISNFLIIEFISFVFLISLLKSLKINKFLFLFFSLINEAILIFFHFYLIFFFYKQFTFRTMSYTTTNKYWCFSTSMSCITSTFLSINF